MSLNLVFQNYFDEVSLQLVLTAVNVIAIISLVIITYLYTKATKNISSATYRMVELEAERKVWEVQPILVPYYGVVMGTGLAKATKGLGRFPLLEVGVKNIGRGVAIIEAYDMRFEGRPPEMKQLSYYLPIYCDIGDTFIEKRIEETSDNKFDKFKTFLEIEYKDVHGNWYFTSYQKGVLKSGKLEKKD